MLHSFGTGVIQKATQQSQVAGQHWRSKRKLRCQSYYSCVAWQLQSIRWSRCHKGNGMNMIGVSTYLQPLKLGKLGCSVSMSFTVFCSASCSAHCCLQQGQLWTILAVLASTLGPEDRDASKLSEYWELPYIQTLQLSISSLKDTVNLQCKFEARTNGDQDQVCFFSSLFWKDISRGAEA